MADMVCCCIPSLDCCCAGDLKVKFAAAKWFHFGLFTFSAIVTWILRDYADDALDWVPEMDSCDSADGQDDRNACFGKGAVLRMSFALFAFHFMHALFLIQCKFVDDPRKSFHTDCLSFKFSIWVGLVILAFFIPDDFYQVYGEIARVLSGFFLVFQALVIINLIYTINESMVDRDECIFPLIGGALSTFALSFAFIIVGYAYYAPRGSCSTTVFWITWTLILGIIVTLISISKWRIENAGLFTSGIVLAYCSFLLLNALNSVPDDSECVEHGGLDAGWIQVVSFFIALGVVLMSTLSVGTADVSDNYGDGDPLPYRPDYFHAIFALAALYVAMLFTNWDLDDVPGEFDIDESWTSAWVKIASQWLVFVLYGWTLLAPKILVDRDFS